MQDPAATYVAGFRAWLALGYSVRKAVVIVSARLGDTRRWALDAIGAQMCAGDTGAMHGPAPKPCEQLHEAAAQGARPRP